MLLLWYCTSVVYIMSESSYNLRPRVKTRSRSETRSALSREPSPVTRSAVARTILTGEKGPVPGQHPVPEVVGSVVAPVPGPEMWSRQVFSLYILQNSCNIRKIFLSCRILPVWNSLPANTNFSSLAAFRRTVYSIDLAKFLHCSND